MTRAHDRVIDTYGRVQRSSNGIYWWWWWWGCVVGVFTHYVLLPWPALNYLWWVTLETKWDRDAWWNHSIQNASSYALCFHSFIDHQLLLLMMFRCSVIHWYFHFLTLGDTQSLSLLVLVLIQCPLTPIVHNINTITATRRQTSIKRWDEMGENE